MANQRAQLPEDPAENGSGAQPDADDLFQLTLKTDKRDIGHIKQETELKFMLLRHWTLFDSI